MSTYTLRRSVSTRPAAPAMPGHERLIRTVAAVAIVGGPLGYLLGGALEPAAGASGRVTIAANLAANPVTNAAHMVAFVVASFLLPIGAAGLGYLAMRRAPWLATLGGLLGVLGWLPFAALTALDGLVVVMAQLHGSGGYATLWDRFAHDATMNTYLIIYIVGHLVAYVLLGIALRRARVLPVWASVSMIASSPLMIAAFAVPKALGGASLAVATVAVALLVIGSLPAARRIVSRA